MHRVQMPRTCLSDDAAPIPVGLSNALGTLIQVPKGLPRVSARKPRRGLGAAGGLATMPKRALPS
jgi:hypothetical protein